MIPGLKNLCCIRYNHYIVDPRMNVKLTNKNSELELTIGFINSTAYLDNTRAVTITALPLHRGNEMQPRCWGHHRHHRTVFRGTRPNFLQRGNKTQ